MRTRKISELLEQYPFIGGYLEDNQFDITGYEEGTYRDYLNHFSEEEIEDKAMDIAQMEEDFFEYIKQMTRTGRKINRT